MKSLSVHVRSYEKHEDEWRRVRYAEMIKDYGQKYDQTGDKAKDQLQNSQYKNSGNNKPK